MGKQKRQWGFPVQFINTKRGRKVVKIELYKYEQVELARHNIQACKLHATTNNQTV